MPDLSPAIFAFTLVLLSVLGTVLAAVGFGYSKGYFTRVLAPLIFCSYCGAKIGWARRVCGRCGAPVWRFIEA